MIQALKRILFDIKFDFTYQGFSPIILILGILIGLFILRSRRHSKIPAWESIGVITISMAFISEIIWGYWDNLAKTAISHRISLMLIVFLPLIFLVFSLFKSTVIKLAIIILGLGWIGFGWIEPSISQLPRFIRYYIDHDYWMIALNALLSSILYLVILSCIARLYLLATGSNEARTRQLPFYRNLDAWIVIVFFIGGVSSWFFQKSDPNTNFLHSDQSAVKENKAKLLVVGFDGMDYSLTRMTIDSADLSFEPYPLKNHVAIAVTGPSWASFYTGLDQDIHGVMDYWGRPEENSNIFSDIEPYTFWKIIESKGYETYLFNLPISPNGFPFDRSAQKDIVNWVQSDEPVSAVTWREKIRAEDIESILERVEIDTYQSINVMDFSNKEIVFLQFSFLDRIGHTLTYANNKTVKSAYRLSYKILNDLYKRIDPEYLIVVSDHGFGRYSTSHDDAVIGTLLINDRMAKFLRWHVSKYPMEQTFIFDEILRIFGINDYRKPLERIPRTSERTSNGNDNSEVLGRLRKLGYIE